MTATERLAACYTGAVHDVMRAAGFRDFVLPQDIRPVVHGRGMAGPVFTMEGRVVPGMDAHETLALRGVAGYLTDGGCRDIDHIEGIDLPVYARYFTPRDIVGYWTPATYCEPMRIGKVNIRNGDYLLADKDGALAIPAESLPDILEATETIMQTENKVRMAILAGKDPQEAYRTYGKF